jgi:metal-sulfur cluster biosynthetic enzyme
VVDLGLLYGIRVDDSNNIVVTMTMTSPMCPVTSVILADAQLRIANIPDVGKVDIDLVWDPAWNPDMIAEEIRIGIM